MKRKCIVFCRVKVLINISFTIRILVLICITIQTEKQNIPEEFDEISVEGTLEKKNYESSVLSKNS